MTSAISRFRRASRRSAVRMDCQWKKRQPHLSPRGAAETRAIHAEDDFAVALRAYARSFGKSVNQTVKDVFAPILGLSEPAAENLWVRFYGAGAKVDGRARKRDLANMRRIDEDMWK